MENLKTKDINVFTKTRKVAGAQVRHARVGNEILDRVLDSFNK